MRCKYCGCELAYDEFDDVYHQDTGYINCGFHLTKGEKQNEFYAEPFKFNDYLNQAEKCVVNIVEEK